MRADCDDYYRRPWTRQPGHSKPMHVAIEGPSDIEVPEGMLRSSQVDSMPKWNIPYAEGGSSSSLFKLRDYQAECIYSVFNSWDKGENAPLIVLPTGAGKTIIAAGIMDQAFANDGHRSIFIAHRQELLTQTIEKMQIIPSEVAPRIGLIQAKKNELGRDITVASIQTLGGSRSQRRLQEFIEAGPYHKLIVDEAHHAVSPQYVRFISAVREAYPDVHLLGMTATPGRADGTALDNVFSKIVFERNLLDMIKLGYLVPPKGYKVDLGLNLDRVRTSDGDYVRAQLSKLMNQAPVNHAVVEAWCKYGHNRKTMVFAVDVQHAENLAQEFRDAGYTAECVHGKMGKRDRKAVFKRFREGPTKILTNCFDADTEILTKRGWVSINTVKYDDITAAVDMNGKAKWEPIRAIVKRQRAPGERMMRVHNQRLDIRVTEGHRIMFAKSALRKWRIDKASSLFDRTSVTWLPMAGTGSHVGIDLSLDELRFIGLFLTDGNLCSSSRGISIYSSNTYKDTLQPKIESILDGCGFDWKQHKAPPGSMSTTDGIVYRVPAGIISGSLKRNGYARLLRYLTKGSLKELNDSCDSSQFWALLEGMWLGDGTKEWTRDHKRPRSLDVWNTDHRLLDQLQAMAVVRGFAANISGPRDNGEGKLPMYRIRVRPRDWCATNLKGRRMFLAEPDWHDEQVWCVTNTTGTVIARRNGKAFVSGQCEIATEGFDEPSVEAILFARPTQSQALYIQAMGRGLRLHPGKTECLIIDCVGNSEKHRPVQLATLTGFDPEGSAGTGSSRGNGDGSDLPDLPDGEVPTVVGHDVTGREIDLTSARASVRYQWRETKLGWVLSIPRIGYYLVAWATKNKTRCTIRFYDQRPGRKQSPAVDVVKAPIDFHMAYGLVEAEMDRIMNARFNRSVVRRPGGGIYEDPDAEDREFQTEDDEPLPEVNFVDLDDGLTEQIELPEELLLRDAAWRSKKPTEKQKELLRKLGVKEKSIPDNAGEASDLISILRIEKDAKMRLPATRKQIAYLKVNELPLEKGMTKGKASRMIWQHKKATGR